MTPGLPEAAVSPEDEAWLRESRAASGLGEKIEDRVVIEHIVELVVGS